MSGNHGSCMSITTRLEKSLFRWSNFASVCSKGFYVRTYAHDIGETLGCGAHLSDLRRTRSGRFDLERSVTFEQTSRKGRERTSWNR